MLETIILYTMSCVVMFLAGAATARGCCQHKYQNPAQQEQKTEDAYARDFAALMGYSGEQNKLEDENET